MLNGVGKKVGGIKGITKTMPALCRGALSCNLQSHVAMETRLAFGLRSGDDLTHTETTRVRKRVHQQEENSMFEVIKRLRMFSDDLPETLRDIVNEDLATIAIEEKLLSASR